MTCNIEEGSAAKSVAAVPEGPLEVLPAVVESKEQYSTAQSVGVGTLPATATREGPTSGGSAPGEVQLRSRSRRANAGSKLRGILAEEKRTLSDVDSEESGVDAVDSESGESHSHISQCCCVCSAAVSSEDVLVHCCAPQCSAVAHCKCGGYTTKGAKRAKFYCPTCRARGLIARSGKSKTHSPSPIATIATQEATQHTAQHSGKKNACLCDQDNFCPSCVSLQAVAKRLSQSVSDSRRENQTLKLHILSLEDKIRTLEEAVKSLGRLDSMEREIESLKSAQVQSRQSQPFHGPRLQSVARPQRYNRPRQLVDPGRKGEDIEGASLKPSSFQRTNDRTGQQTRDAKRRRSTNPFCESFRIVWGTRFTTSAPTLRSTIAGILKEQLSEDIRVVRSVKGRDGKARWWFTVMAQPSTLEILDSTWEVGTSSSHWKLLKAFGSPTPAGLSHDSSSSTSSGLPTRQSSFGVQSPTVPPHTLKAAESAVRVATSISTCSSSTEVHGAVVNADASSDAGKSSDKLTDTTILPESPLSSEVPCNGNGTEDSQCG